jgi:hypothetical protein
MENDHRVSFRFRVKISIDVVFIHMSNSVAMVELVILLLRNHFQHYVFEVLDRNQVRNHFDFFQILNQSESANSFIL